MDVPSLLPGLAIFAALSTVGALMWRVLEAECGDAATRRAVDTPERRAPAVEPVVRAALALAPVDLEPLVVATIGRWTATPRRWLLGHTDDATVSADGEALTSAIDGLVRIAVRNTGPGDPIDVSIERDRDSVSVIVTHTAAPVESGADTRGRSETLTVPTFLRAVVRAHAGSISETRIGCQRLYRLSLPVTGRSA